MDGRKSNFNLLKFDFVMFEEKKKFMDDFEFLPDDDLRGRTTSSTDIHHLPDLGLRSDSSDFCLLDVDFKPISEPTVSQKPS
ncbi:unnamed protein product [Brassica oleracea var. botrytis]|uniref:Uncharacterized protein n=2 Tax=Brassica TaxID=3705 RepID=A0A3P6DNC4_BRAOL|nr:unnamed protein product [Brassica napus]CDY53634.1 BnaC09g53970D [Brassica napus]VDD32883.1 unnamed protein product [Brassica oleracea]